MRTLALFLILFVSIAAPSQTVTHGPVVGAVTNTEAQFVLRVSSQANVAIELSTSPNFTSPIQTSAVAALAADTFFVKIPASGLSPSTTYFYRPVINGVPTSEVRRFRTFPNPNTVENFAFAFGSCQQDGDAISSGNGRVFPFIARNLKRFASDPDIRFMLHLGDWGYPDTTDTPSNPTNYFNLNYRNLQAAYMDHYKRTYPMDSVFKVMPIAYVHSDHDYSNNNCDSAFPGRANTLRAYQRMFPHYPLANPSTSSGGVWQKFRFGNAEFFLLDTRATRSPNINAFPNFLAWLANPVSQTNPNGVRLRFEAPPNHKIISDEQMNWLIQGLQQSTATWKFIVCPETFNPAQRGVGETALLLQGSRFDPITTPQGTYRAAEIAIDIADGWSGFPASVSQLVRAVRNAQIRNVIIISGDSHNVGTDDGANSLFPEFMAGGLDQDNSRAVSLFETFNIFVWNRARQGLSRNNFNSAYGRVSVFGNDSVRVDYIDEFGALIDSYTQPAGHLVQTKGLTIAPQGVNFDTVRIGTVSQQALNLVNTGADTVTVFSVNRATPSRPSPFIVNPPSPIQLSFPLRIPPGQSRVLGFAFAPQTQGFFADTVVIASDDPDNVFGLGNGVSLAILVGRGATASGIASSIGKATDYVLEQNYPNPFNPQTTIGFAIPKPEFVSLVVYDALGRKVATLVNERMEAGRYEVKFDGSGLASGVYFYQIKAGAFTQTAKMVFTK
ncbi:MAG: alkaline phosphatase D family protein [Chloroherpetonaceae bacterium]|nr:alkaline phosphatase D family protein [Chloroherpetonaceae bacterium]MDW8438618.1 alkaline phosphatase D family protein [Chloroherpetonaceae bacterium]